VPTHPPFECIALLLQGGGALVPIRRAKADIDQVAVTNCDFMSTRPK
jgi:hypothetical protein